MFGTICVSSVDLSDYRSYYNYKGEIPLYAVLQHPRSHLNEQYE